MTAMVTASQNSQHAIQFLHALRFTRSLALPEVGFALWTGDLGWGMHQGLLAPAEAKWARHLNPRLPRLVQNTG